MGRFAPLALIAVAMLAACGQKGTQTITTSSGQVTVGQGAVDAGKLGVPLYPGAQQSENGALSMSGQQGSGEMVTLTTKDNFDQVYSWYKSQLPADAEKMKVSDAGESMATFAVGDPTKEQTSVIITGKPDETSILISHEVKNISPEPTST
jgi:putative lipoprotein